MLDFGDRRIMGCSVADLERWVRELTGLQGRRLVSGRLDLSEDGIPLCILARELAPRSIGLVSFAQLEVGFEYQQHDAV
ncbi:MAG: hypothetical protein VW339_09770, partial [Quisquiliibacterium sp.]